MTDQDMRNIGVVRAMYEGWGFTDDHDALDEFFAD